MPAVLEEAARGRTAFSSALNHSNYFACTNTNTSNVIHLVLMFAAKLFHHQLVLFFSFVSL